MVTPAKKKGGGGLGGRASSVGRVTKSATPAAERPVLKLKLKFGLVPKASEERTPSTHSKARRPQNKRPVEDEELPEGEPAARTTRRGRTVRPPQNSDVVYGSDLDDFIEQKLNSKTHDEDYQSNIASSPREYHRRNKLNMQENPLSTPAYHSGTPNVQILQLQPKRKPGRPPKTAHFHPSPEATTSSDTLAPLSPHRPSAFLTDIDPSIYQIMNVLRSTPRIYIDLPALTNASNTRAEQPYTAKFLTHMYLICYDAHLWNLCDLIADTWIRAFHALRKQGEKDARYQFWRPNPALESRKLDMQKHARLLRKLGRKPPPAGAVGFDSNPSEYELDVVDPALAHGVTDFDRRLLNELYTHTHKKCGARLLWADAMALGGDKMENVLEKGARRGEEWHADLLFDVMQTSLRMVRRKMTLKIEESTEGSWCKRYHEHGKYGLPCYREVAWRQGGEVEEDASSDEDEDDEDEEDEDGMDVDVDLEAQIMEELETGTGRGSGGARMGTEVSDVDAEGESE